MEPQAWMCTCCSDTPGHLQLRSNIWGIEVRMLVLFLQKWVDGKPVKKVIYVPGKILNIVC